MKSMAYWIGLQRIRIHILLQSKEKVFKFKFQSLCNKHIRLPHLVNIFL